MFTWLWNMAASFECPQPLNLFSPPPHSRKKLEYAKASNQSAI